MKPEILAPILGCSLGVARIWADPLLAAMMEYGIMSRMRAAMFLAQVGHESGGLQWLTELWGPTEAQRGYEGRKDLGNVQPGDGSRFRGHGPIQITGRANHAAARDQLRVRLGTRVPDFEQSPELLCLPEWGSYSAGNFWHQRGLNAVADTGDIRRCTSVINGGQNGIDDRKLRYQRALTLLA